MNLATLKPSTEHQPSAAPTLSFGRQVNQLTTTRRKVVLTQKAPQAATGNVGKTWGARLGGLSEQRREPINVIKPKTVERPRSSITKVNLDHRECFVTLPLQLVDHRLVGSDRLKGDLLLR